MALRRWYVDARPLLTGSDPWRAQVITAGRESVDSAIAERIKQLGNLVRLIPESADLLDQNGSDRQAADQRRLIELWPRLKETLLDHASLGNTGVHREAALKSLAQGEGSYTQVMKGLSTASKESVETWLSDMVTDVVSRGKAVLAAT